MTGYTSRKEGSVGEIYCFDQRWDEQNEKWINGFFYQNESNGFDGIFVEFDEDQKKFADDWIKRQEDMNRELESKIKEWISHD